MKGDKLLVKIRRNFCASVAGVESLFISSIAFCRGLHRSLEQRRWVSLLNLESVLSRQLLLFSSLRCFLELPIVNDVRSAALFCLGHGR